MNSIHLGAHQGRYAATRFLEGEQTRETPFCRPLCKYPKKKQGIHPTPPKNQGKEGLQKRFRQFRFPVPGRFLESYTLDLFL